MSICKQLFFPSVLDYYLDDWLSFLCHLNMHISNDYDLIVVLYLSWYMFIPFIVSLYVVMLSYCPVCMTIYLLLFVYIFRFGKYWAVRYDVINSPILLVAPSALGVWGGFHYFALIVYRLSASEEELVRKVTIAAHFILLWAPT